MNVKSTIVVLLCANAMIAIASPVLPQADAMSESTPVEELVEADSVVPETDMALTQVNGKKKGKKPSRPKPSATYDCHHTDESIGDDEGKNSVCRCSNGAQATQKWSNDQILNNAKGVPKGWNNGCGGTGKGYQVAFFKGAFPASFQHCCSVHDVGYGDCNGSKKDADEAFMHCVYHKANTEPGARGKAYAKKAADGWTNVWEHNAEFFDNKQKKNCSCK